MFRSGTLLLVLQPLGKYDEKGMPRGEKEAAPVCGIGFACSGRVPLLRFGGVAHNDKWLWVKANGTSLG